jgi:hypothetical protein
MTIFDLFFLVGSLALLFTLLAVLVQAIRGRWGRAGAILQRAAVAVAIYFLVIVAVSLVTPRRVVPMGTAQCFDDWCIAVMTATHHRAGADDSLAVTMELSSRARGISQGERDVRVYLLDGEGREYQPVPDPAAVPLSTRMPPLGRVTVTRAFRLPVAASRPALVVAHGAFPGCCIIAGGESVFHRRTVVPLS